MKPCAAILALTGAFLSGAGVEALAWTQPARARNGMVVSQEANASRVGLGVLREGGNAVDAVVATAFALAVTHPRAGNIGGGGFLLYRPASGQPVVYDFRETAPAAATPEMFLKDGGYDASLHHDSFLSVGVPGTVAGLYMAWKENGKLPWKRLVEPAVRLARRGFELTEWQCRSIREVLPQMRAYPASMAQFTKNGSPYEAGDLLRQPELARTLQRIASAGPAGFYDGETAALIEKEMKRGGGLITLEDLKSYRAVKRQPLRGTYRGYEVLAVPPPSSGGAVLIEILNLLEGYHLGFEASGGPGSAPGSRLSAALEGPGSAAMVHVTVEAMRRAFADRAQFLGDPDFNPLMPVERLTSKSYAARLRHSIRLDKASSSSPTRFEWPPEGEETTHISVVDSSRAAVALTTTLEQGYGSGIVVSGAGFLLNNEMGDFNAGPGLTDAEGLIGTHPNLAAPGKRMLSSMAPTILTREGKLSLVAGSLGGRSIISTVLLTILNVVDFGMNVQEAVDAPRFHHQWLPDSINVERWGLSPDTAALLQVQGHALNVVASQGVAQAIAYDPAANILEGAWDRRDPDGAAAGM